MGINSSLYVWYNSPVKTPVLGFLAGGQGVVAAGIEMATLLLEI